MHELSIAIRIVDLAQEEAARRSVKVTAVHLLLGALADVIKTALMSSYEMACEDTLRQGSQLIVEEIPVVVYCSRCQMRRPLSILALLTRETPAAIAVDRTSLQDPRKCCIQG